MADNGIILLVEDDVELNTANRRALELLDYTVYSALTLAEARKRLSETIPDIILLDIMLPDGDGFSFLNEIQGETNGNVDVIFLTAKTERENILRGLNSGGEDYITKPFHPAEMLARLDVVMRRRKKSKSLANKMSIGNLSYDKTLGKAYISGKALILTPIENALLRLFMENENETMRVELIYEKVWGQPMCGYDRTTRNHIKNLRNKLAESGCSHNVNNAYGKGYGLTEI